MLVPTPVTSGLTSPASPIPRDELELTSSSLPGMSCWKSPAVVSLTVTGWLAWSAARIASAADLITWTTGIVALPAMPAAKVSSSSPMITPIAPASAAF